MKIKELVKDVAIGMMLGIELILIILAGLQLYDMKLTNDYVEALEASEYYYE